jgi:hypothetical protein
MTEQTLSFVLKLRVLYPNADADGAPLLRGSLVQVGAAHGQHFDSLGRLVEILNSSMNHTACEAKTEESKCESHSDG